MKHGKGMKGMMAVFDMQPMSDEEMARHREEMDREMVERDGFFYGSKKVLKPGTYMGQAEEDGAQGIHQCRSDDPDFDMNRPRKDD